MSDADVIIIGSGPAGVSAAWPLVEAGVRVLMLDASGEEPQGLPAHQSIAELRMDAARWRTELGNDRPIVGSDVSPKFATPLARATLDGFVEAAGVTTENYMALGSHAPGGLSRIWGALAARYRDTDIAAWQDEAKELCTSYDRVAGRIGVTGGREIADIDPSSLAPPIAHLARRHRVADAPEFRVVTAPNAVLDTPRAERLGCNSCGLCLQGCSRGSIYHSALELPALRRFRNFAYRRGIAVSRLSTAGGMQVAEACTNGVPVRFRAPAIVLAAGTLATTSLALRRIGHVGVPIRIESNPVGGIAFVVPHLLGKALPERAFGLGQLFYSLDVEPHVEAAGVFYGADTLPLAPVADRMPFTRPVALRAARALAPALILATAYLPGRFSDNQIIVEEDGASGRVRIVGRQTDQAERQLGKTFAKLARLARKRGAWNIPGSRQRLIPGADAHPAGTLPMNGSGPAATGVDGSLNGAPGVFVADGAALPTLSARHPTLTIMANADRVGRLLARRHATLPGAARAS